MGRGGTRCCCCCRCRSPAFVRTHPPSFTFTRSHSPTPVHPLPFAHSHSRSPFARSRSRSPALPHSHLICACSVIRSFSLHVASVCTRLCPLGCVSVCADPRYPVALVWPSFGLCLRSSPACLRSSPHVRPRRPRSIVPICPYSFVCSFVLFPVCSHYLVSPASGLCLYQMKLVNT